MSTQRLPEPSPSRAAELFPDSPTLQARWLKAQELIRERHLEPKPFWGLVKDAEERL